MNVPDRPAVAEEQLRYARVLEFGARLGLAVAVAAFALYLGGVLPGHVRLDALPSLWALPLAEYLRLSATPTGWQWIRLATHGDFASLGGIAILATVSIACLGAAIPVYAKRGDRVYVAICIAAIVVLLLAASGVFLVSH